MDQTISLFSGTHLTLPTVVLNFGESASFGTGMWISTLLAVDLRLNWLFAYRKVRKNHISKHEHYACKFRELPDNFPLPQSAERQHNTNVQINFSKEKSPRETGGGCVRRCCWWSTENNQKRRQTSHNYFRTSDLDHVLDAAVGMFFNHGLNPDQWLHLMGRYFTAVDFTLPWSQSCHFLIKLHWIHEFHKQELTHKQKAAKTGRH